MAKSGCDAVRAIALAGYRDYATGLRELRNGILGRTGRQEHRHRLRTTHDQERT